MIIPFDSRPREVRQFDGNDTAGLDELRMFVQRQKAAGGTDIYAAASAALAAIADRKDREDYQVSVILMTDGRSTGSFDEFKRAWDRTPVPVFTIMFGDADPAQLERIAATTRARSFDGRSNLVNAFREAKGYN
jgi:Ca-activated chloride channel family protein